MNASAQNKSKFAVLLVLSAGAAVIAVALFAWLGMPGPEGDISRELEQVAGEPAMDQQTAPDDKIRRDPEEIKQELKVAEFDRRNAVAKVTDLYVQIGAARREQKEKNEEIKNISCPKS